MDRIVDWAWSPEDKSHIDDESIRLCGTALAWFLTTSNRFLRDRATKALVRLFTPRIHLVNALILQFRDVDDPYVLERLLAAAYGCALRSTDHEAIVDLAKNIYSQVFEGDSLPSHILLRDYARGAIEVACEHVDSLDIDLSRVRPPYHSDWPADIPSTEDLKRYGEWREDQSEGEIALSSIYDSVMGSGDFARYIIGTNWSRRGWTTRRLAEPRTPSRRERYESFVESLTSRQSEAWKRYHALRDGVAQYRRTDETRIKEKYAREFSEEELSSAVGEAEAAVRGTLGKRKSQQLDDVVLPYLDDPRDELLFDLSVAQRFIFQRVLDLGWTVERFGTFDRHVARLESGGRTAYKAERIGKKYQWIAYHEFLARYADNFELRRDFWGYEPEEYVGPWQFNARDIDPSFLLTSTHEDIHNQDTCWWSLPFDSWHLDLDPTTWLQRTEDCPDTRRLIQIGGTGNGSSQLALQGTYVWEEPTPPEEERFGRPRREIWYMLNSYIVHKGDADDVYQWLTSHDIGVHAIGSRMYDVFLGEFPWATSFIYQDNTYHSRPGWTRPIETMPADILTTGDEYITEDVGFDCSVDRRLEIRLPAKWVVDGLTLRWNGTEGCFFDSSGKLVAVDPSVREAGPGALLVERDEFLGFLHDKGYDLVWVLGGEKLIIGGMLRDEDWPGRLEIKGVYRVRGAEVEGEMRTNFIPPPSAGAGS